MADKRERSLLKVLNDGMAFVQMMVSDVIPQSFQKMTKQANSAKKEGNTLAFTGCFTENNGILWIEEIAKLIDTSSLVSVDLSQCQKIDQRGLGMLLMLKTCAQTLRNQCEFRGLKNICAQWCKISSVLSCICCAILLLIGSDVICSGIC